MKKKCLFLTILLLGFQLGFIEPSWPAEPNENNKLLASALKDLQQTIIEKIEHEADTTATAFADAQNIERDLSLKDIFRTPLVIIEETINTIGSLINARKLTENANQILDSSETNLQLVSGIMSITTLKQIGENLQLAIDGPSYCSTIEKMLDKAYRRSSTRIKFNPDAYKTVIKDYLYAQYEPGPLRIPHKCTDFTRRNLEIAWGTYQIEHSIKERFRALRDKLEDNPLSSFSALEAANQIEKIRRAIVASKGSNQEISYETYLKNKTGNYVPTTVDLTIGSIAELEKVRQIAVEHHEKEMKIEQITTISKAVRAAMQATILYIKTTYKSPKTGEILGEVQKWSLIPLTIEVGLFRPFGTNAREQVNMIPQEMMMTLPLELSNVWMIADDTASYIEYLIETEKQQPPKPAPLGKGILAEIKLKDKSIIKGEIQQEKIKIKTKYGEMNIPVEDFTSIIGELIKLKDGTTLKGNFAEKTLSVKTDYGKLKVETKDIDFIIFAKEEPPVEPLLPSQEKIPIPEFHGVYLVANGKLIEIKDRFLEVGGVELKTLSGIDILDPNAYIIFYRDYPPTAYRKVGLIELRYNDSSRTWKLGSKEIELKTAPLKGKIIAYKLIPTVSLSPGAYSLLLIRSIGGLFPDFEMFDFTVNYEKYQQPLKRTQLIMGTMVEITVVPPDEQAIMAAFKEIRKVDALMSTYKENSEVSILNREGENRLSPETLQVIHEALKFSKLTRGAFDITCKPLINLWKKAKKEKVIPPPEEIKKALSLVGREKIVLEGDLARFKQKGMQIDLGGIAKGYAVDRAIEVLKENGIKQALVNAGGDSYALGTGLGGEKWLVGIQVSGEMDKLLDAIKVKDVGVATSGDYRRYFTIEGRRFSHVINPKTGQTVQDVPMSVTVIAPDATTADALATAVFVLGPQKGIELIDNLPGVEGMIVGEGMKRTLSKGWANMEMMKQGAPLKAKMARAFADMRSIADALESHYVDNLTYPNALADLVPTYITSLPKDPFSDADPSAYRYYLHDSATAWLLVSNGPDGKEDVKKDAISWADKLQIAGQLRGPDGALSGYGLKAGEGGWYDPSAGATSAGDLGRGGP